MNSTAMHQNSVRIYVEDVDFMGIVYHANYLRYFERARTEMLRHNQLLLSDLIKSDILFAIKELAIKYILPARLDDLLTVTTQIKELRACSIVFEQKINNQQGILICEATVHVVCVDGSLKPKRVPKVING